MPVDVFAYLQGKKACLANAVVIQQLRHRFAHSLTSPSFFYVTTVHAICSITAKKAMAQVRIKNERILSDDKYRLKEVEFEKQKKDGLWETQKRQVFDHGNAVTVLLYNQEKKTVVLTKQFRIAIYGNGNQDGMLLETPAGLIEKDEAPETSIRREIKEETGYELPLVHKVFEAYSSAGILTELIHFYVAPYTDAQKTGEGGGLPEEGEELTVVELNFQDALAMVERGEIRDAKTILLLQHAAVQQLLG